MSAEASASAATNAALKGATEVLDVFLDWVVPILMVGVGFYIGVNSLIGGPWTVANLIVSSGVKNIPSGLPNLIGGGVFAAAYGCAALGCWKAGDGEGTMRSYILRPLAGLFAGLSIGSLAWGIVNKPIQGPLDTEIQNLEAAL